MASSLDPTTDNELLPASIPAPINMRDLLSCQVAARLFLENGIESVRMTDVAKGAGVGVATLYRHFSTKGRLAAGAGILIWKRFNRLIAERASTAAYAELSGLERLASLMDYYCETYAMQPGFMRFLDEFDRLALLEGLKGEELMTAYTAEVNASYPIFKNAYELGLKDGSIAREVDFNLFFRTVSHALMGVAQKMLRGEVIQSDDFGQDARRAELDCIAQMARITLTTK